MFTCDLQLLLSICNYKIHYGVDMQHAGSPTFKKFKDCHHLPSILHLSSNSKNKSDHIQVGYVLAPSPFISFQQSIFLIFTCFCFSKIPQTTLEWRQNKVFLRCVYPSHAKYTWTITTSNISMLTCDLNLCQHAT